MLLLFAPLPYVDVSASWANRNRYERDLVGAAGMMSDLVVAGIATVVWAHTAPGWGKHGGSITTAINSGTDAYTSIPRITIKPAAMSIICISGVLLRAVSMVLIIAGTQIQSTSPTDVAQRLVKNQKNAPV